jgi:O-antigen/teichoic acid export membrane protein
MTDPRTPRDETLAEEPSSVDTSHVRGSTLLLVGRVLSIGINIVSQALIARHLSQAEFGAFALAFSIASVGQVFITLGLHRGATQFFSRYEEANDHRRLVGTILLNIAVVVALGAVLVLGVALAQGALTSSGLLDPTATGLLLILVTLAPIDALDDMLIALFAVFGSPRSIFLRRYLIGPLLRLIVAAILVLADGNATALAIGYLLATLLGLAAYGAIFARILARRGVFRTLRTASPIVPAREVLAFSVPLLSNDGVWLLINTLPLVVLGASRGLEEVAAFQVIRPAAALNQIVSNAFYVLYLPAASRLALRRDPQASGQLFWRTAIWVTVMSFPIFAGTFALGRPIAGLLFGERYEPSGVYLSILAVGYAINSALGFSGVTLAANGHGRTVAVVNALTAVIGVVLALILIPVAGALGAAIASALTLILQSAILQITMRRQVGIELVDREAIRVFSIVAVAALALVLIQALMPFGWWTVLAAVIASLAVLYLCRDALRIEALFPEVGQVVDRLTRIVGARRPGGAA